MITLGQDGVPSISDWLIDELPANSVVGADPKMINYGLYGCIF